MKRLSLALMVATAGLALAADNPAPAVSPAKAAFEKLKGLNGEWEGTAGEHAGKAGGQQVHVTYRTASNGSVVQEDLFPGTDHEMISMYHLDGDSLVMTHYCALGNQPRMRLGKASSPDELRFDFDGGTNFKPETDRHIHSGRIKWLSPDQIEAEWAVYQGTKQVGANKFLLMRKK